MGQLCLHQVRERETVLVIYFLMSFPLSNAPSPGTRLNITSILWSTPFNRKDKVLSHIRDAITRNAIN